MLNSNIIKSRLLSKIVHVDSGCWIWTGQKSQKGYGVLQIQKKNKIKKYRAHRLSYEVFKEPIPEGLYVCHSCDTPACINPDHLWVGTVQENNADKVAKQRGNTRLSVEKVIEIKKMLAEGYSKYQIAEIYDVHPRTIFDIKTGRTWRHVM
jgi:hypothetical protein